MVAKKAAPFLAANFSEEVKRGVCVWGGGGQDV